MCSKPKIAHTLRVCSKYIKCNYFAAQKRLGTSKGKKKGLIQAASQACAGNRYSNLFNCDGSFYAEREANTVKEIRG